MSDTAFSLASVLRLRELERNACRQQWLDACRDLENLQQRVETVTGEIAELHQRVRRTLRGGHVPLDHLQIQHGYEQTLKLEADELRRASDQADQARQERQAALVVAEQAVRALEKLKERQGQLTRKRTEHKAQQALDEAAARRAA